MTPAMLVATAICAAWPLAEALRQALAWRSLRGDRMLPPRDDAPDRFAHVDVLQPIRSGDPTLGEALGASLRTLGARGATLHWLIDEDDPAAAGVVRGVLARERAHAAQARVTQHPPCPAGLNPKLFKLDRALSQCAGRVVLVLDDDARLPAASLDALLDALARDATRLLIATALPAYLPAPGLGSRLLARFVNDHAPITYLPARLGDRSPTINGMCWAMHRDALAAIGGFAPRLRHLTDDLAMAQAVLAAGGRIAQCREPVWMRTALPDVAAYTRQMHRWMLFAHLLLRTQPLSQRLRIVFGQGLPSLLPLAAVVAFAIVPTWTGAIGLVAGAGMHVLGRRTLQRACAGTAAKAEPATSLVIALLLPLHLLHALLDRRIRWRSHRYRVFANDRFEEAT
ncbi:MAG: glycosyltransferase [Lysobacteraceae bacterium]